MKDLKFNNLKFSSEGLIPAIVQDYKTKDILMLAYMNDESLKLTIETGKAHYYSRSRKKLWQKGETSGNFQQIINIRYDCDKDTLLLIVSQTGNACHTGNFSCFYEDLDGQPANDNVFQNCNKNILNKVYDIIMDRKNNPLEGSYTNYLFDKGIDKMLKKVGEESSEVIIAAKNDNKDELVYEISDLMYHLCVVMVEKNISWENIYSELERRRS